jgi:hypothetical protein
MENPEPSELSAASRPMELIKACDDAARVLQMALKEIFEHARSALTCDLPSTESMEQIRDVADQALHTYQTRLSNNGVSSSASSVSSPESPPSSSAAVIEEEKWQLADHCVDISDKCSVNVFYKDSAAALVDAHNASLGRVKKKVEKELGK